MRTLAVDLGSRRVGVALSDAGGTLASPYEVLNVSGAGQAMGEVLSIIEKEGVERVVVGVPLNMDDSLGGGARAAIEWGKELERRSGKAIVYVDERLSSFAAEQQLIDRKRAGEKLTRGKKKRQLDALAAAGFLQAFLDGRLTAMPVG